MKFPTLYGAQFLRNPAVGLSWTQSTHNIAPSFPAMRFNSIFRCAQSSYPKNFRLILYVLYTSRNFKNQESLGSSWRGREIGLNETDKPLVRKWDGQNWLRIGSLCAYDGDNRTRWTTIGGWGRLRSMEGSYRVEFIFAKDNIEESRQLSPSLLIPPLSISQLIGAAL
jgi:hypothetical protein